MNSPETPNVVVVSSGGVIQGIFTDDNATWVFTLDWDEVNEGAYSSEELRTWADYIESIVPNAARDLRIAADDQDDLDGVTA